MTPEDLELYKERIPALNHPGWSETGAAQKLGCIWWRCDIATVTAELGIAVHPDSHTFFLEVKTDSCPQVRRSIDLPDLDAQFTGVQEKVNELLAEIIPEAIARRIELEADFEAMRKIK